MEKHVFCSFAWIYVLVSLSKEGKMFCYVENPISYRFHGLSEFDQKKKSCRRRLNDHNARRRKPQPEALSFGSSRLSAMFYGSSKPLVALSFCEANTLFIFLLLATIMFKNLRNAKLHILSVKLISLFYSQFSVMIFKV